MQPTIGLDTGGGATCSSSRSGNGSSTLPPPFSIGEVSVSLQAFADELRCGCEDVTGFEVWRPATSAACRCLLAEADALVRKRNVLELGCGLGALGVACGLLGAAHVVLSDRESAVLGLARQNAEANGVSNRCDFAVVDFAKGRPPFRAGAFDLQVASDVLFLDRLARPLLRTFEVLLVRMPASVSLAPFGCGVLLGTAVNGVEVLPSLASGTAVNGVEVLPSLASGFGAVSNVCLLQSSEALASDGGECGGSSSGAAGGGRGRPAAVVVVGHEVRRAVFRGPDGQPQIEEQDSALSLFLDLATSTGAEVEVPIDDRAACGSTHGSEAVAVVLRWPGPCDDPAAVVEGMAQDKDTKRRRLETTAV
mmetsp:Transcript_101507/g.326223  ORF Transcript_101507/g.326223 Transcript_101507/m.326223 type:complete len:365 (+) Transcript_101507:63-1157(+)